MPQAAGDIPGETGTRQPSLDVGALYHEQWARLVRLAFLLVGSRETAEDLVAGAFLRLEVRPGPPAEPVAYLKRMVVNAARDHHRHAAVARRAPLAPATVTGIPEIDETWEALGRLPERQRQALVLRYYADCTLHQVAELLGCPLGTAKSLIHRGLAALKGELLS